MAAPSTAPRPPVIYCLPTSEVAPRLGDFVIKAQDEAIAKRNKFTLAVSGGSLAKQLVTGLSGRANVQWDKWIVFFADERVVPLDDPESNYKVVHEGLFSKVPIPQENIHAIDTDHLDDPEEVSHDYEKQLMNEFAGKNSVAFPRFDLVLLGTGPDGHTCSLFPKHPLLSEELRWVSWLDNSPKPPSTRITLTLPVLNHAHKVAFVAVGEGKKEVLEKVLDQPALGLPASKVKPIPPGTVYWFIDEAAGELVKHAKTDFKL